MSVLSDTKKAATNDWHRADILAALRKNGWSLRSLAEAGNVSYNTLRPHLINPIRKWKDSSLMRSVLPLKRFGLHVLGNELNVTEDLF